MYCCEDHKHDAENVNLFGRYRKENILCLKSHLPDFSKNIKLSFHCDQCMSHLANQCDEEVTESAVYILQTISIYNKRFNLFFDTGCGYLVCKKEAISI